MIFSFINILNYKFAIHSNISYYFIFLPLSMLIWHFKWNKFSVIVANVTDWFY